jgi:hypothetical protein
VDDRHQRGSSPKSDRIVDLFVHMRSHEMSATTPRTPRGSLRDGEDRRPSSAAQRTPRGSKRQSDRHHGEEHHSMELQSPRGEDDGEVSPLRKVSLGAFGYSGGQHHGKRSHGASERASQKALEEEDDDDEDVDNHVTIHAVGGKKQRGGKH